MAEDSSKVKLIWPDDLCELWDYVRAEDRERADCAVRAGRMAAIYQELLDDLTLALRCDATVSQFYADDDAAHDMALDFLVYLLGESPRPVQIAKRGTLIVELKKFGARKNSISSYEVNEVLREVLHKLEDAGVVVRCGGGTRYRNSTCFALAGGDFKAMADEAAERAVDGVLPMYGQLKRGLKTEKKRFLKPSEAEDLVKRSLSALDAGVFLSIEQMQRIAVKHIRNFPQTLADPYDTTGEGREKIDVNDEEAVRSGTCDLWTSRVEVSEREAEEALRELEEASEREGVPEETMNDIPESSEIGRDGEEELSSGDDNICVGDASAERSHDEYSDDVGLWRNVALRAASEAMTRIWDSVVRDAGTNVFCLYSIPKWNPAIRVKGAEKHPLKEFGEPNRVLERSERQRALFSKELAGLATAVKNSDSDFIRRIQLMAVRHIYDGLVGRCTEKGLNPSL